MAVPTIEAAQCTACGLALPTGWGGFTYAVNSAGQREACGHPMEIPEAERITGLPYSEARSRGLVGYLSHCLCWNCLAQFELDRERDPKCCPSCRSQNLKTWVECLDQVCPRCGEGIVRRLAPGGDPFDADMERLVPPVVAQVVEFEARCEGIPPLLDEAWSAQPRAELYFESCFRFNLDSLKGRFWLASLHALPPDASFEQLRNLMEAQRGQPPPPGRGEMYLVALARILIKAFRAVEQDDLMADHCYQRLDHLVKACPALYELIRCSGRSVVLREDLDPGRARAILYWVSRNYNPSCS